MSWVRRRGRVVVAVRRRRRALAAGGVLDVVARARARRRVRRRARRRRRGGGAASSWRRPMRGLGGGPWPFAFHRLVTRRPSTTGFVRRFLRRRRARRMAALTSVRGLPPGCRVGRGALAGRVGVARQPPSLLLVPTTRPRTWTSSPSGRAPGPARRRRSRSPARCVVARAARAPASRRRRSLRRPSRPASRMALRAARALPPPRRRSSRRARRQPAARPSSAFHFLADCPIQDSQNRVRTSRRRRRQAGE